MNNLISLMTSKVEKNNVSKIQKLYRTLIVYFERKAKSIL